MMVMIQNHDDKYHHTFGNGKRGHNVHVGHKKLYFNYDYVCYNEMQCHLFYLSN